jgi:hypothetical protein
MAPGPKFIGVRRMVRCMFSASLRLIGQIGVELLRSQAEVQAIWAEKG